jgi:hypothetical protein
VLLSRSGSAASDVRDWTQFQLVAAAPGGYSVRMRKQIIGFARRFAEEAGAVVGLRFGTEEPHYTSERVTNRLEIRRYGPRVAAETTVVADKAALSNGFRRIAGYIFGGNHTRTTIAMTAPVAQQSGAKIAMTAPVAQAQRPEGGSVVRFFMPAQWTLESLPEPDNPDVRLVTVPAETVAVLRFTGDRGPRAVEAQTGRLLKALREYGFETGGEPVAWFYDPPWTIPLLRRNEVAVPVKV